LGRGFCWLDFLESIILIYLSHGPSTIWKEFIFGKQCLWKKGFSKQKFIFGINIGF
jgi:hypothetical protein